MRTKLLRSIRVGLIGIGATALSVVLAFAQANPTPDAPGVPSSVSDWKNALAVLLERNKQYPSDAVIRREQGVAQVAFSLDRQGRLLERRIEHSSGVEALDREALALVERAQPFPPPPADLPGDRIDLKVPIRFNLDAAASPPQAPSANPTAPRAPAAPGTTR